MLKEVQNNSSKALALDERGHATGVVRLQDPEPDHLLSDLDVHA
jgi:hypothetical protein